MTHYIATAKEHEDITKIFTFHPVQSRQPERYEHLRAAAKDLALDFLLMCPPSRERSVAITKLQEAIMWANAAIAINEDGV